MKIPQHAPGRLFDSIALLEVLTLLFFCTALSGQTYKWNVGTGNWNVGSNWIPIGVPGAGDTAMVQGNITLTGNTEVSVLAFRGGTITGNFDLTVSDSMFWSDGVLSGDGDLNIPSGSILYVDSTTSKELSERVLENEGTVIWNGSGVWDLTQFCVINNRSSATFNIIDDAFMNFVVPENGGTFNNEGIFKKTAGSATSLIDAELYNTGTIQCDQATLKLDRSVTTAQSGNYVVMNGSKIAFGRKSHSFDDVIFSGNGEVEVVDATLHSTGDGVTIQSGITMILSDVDSRLEGSGDFVFNGNLEWQKGTVTGSGDFTTKDTLEFGGSSSKTLDGQSIINQSIAIISGIGNIRLTNGALIENQFAATFDAQVDAFIDYLAPGGGTFTNAGTLQKTGGSGNTTIDVAMTHSGSVNVTSGTLILTRGGSYTAPISIASGKMMALDGGTHVFDNATVSGSGILQLSSDTLQTSGSGLTVNNDAALTITGGFTTGNGPATINGVLNWSGGFIIGSGGFSVGGGYNITGNADKSLESRAINLGGPGLWSGNGDIKVGSNGQLNIVSDTLQIQTEEDVRFTVPEGGTMSNAGVILKNMASGTCAIELAFSNTGTLICSAGKILFTNGSASSNADYHAYSGGTIEFDDETHSFNNVKMDSSGTILLDQADCTLNGSGLIVDSGADVTMTGSGASINGSGPLTVNGLFRWERGTISGSGSFTVNNELMISSDRSKTLDERTLTNNGTITWNGTGAFRLQNNADILNQSNSVFDIQVDALLDSLNGAGGITNSGTVRKSAGSGTTSIDVSFTNNDSVTVESGILSFTRGGGASNGVYLTSAGAAVDFDGGTHQLSNISADNSGIFQVSSNTVNINGSAAVFGGSGSVNINGGFFSGNANVTIDSEMNWSGGQIGGSGDLIISDSLWISGTNLKSLAERTISNSGVITLSGNGDINVSGNSKIHNLAAGIFQVTSSAEIAYQAPNGGTLENDGLFVKSSAPDSADIGIDFQNDGILDIQEGMLDFKNIFLNSSSGIIKGDGTIRLSNATVTNNGLITPGASPGRLFTRGALPFSASAALTIEIGGTTAGINYDQLVSAQDAELDGTLNLQLINSYVPAHDEVFQIMNYSSKSGTFATVNAIGGGDSISFEVQYNADHILAIAKVAGQTSVTVNAKVWLEGPYASDSMQTTLQKNGLLPLNQPFNTSPWHYNGSENVASIPADVVDWVLVELRSDSTADTKVASRAAFLKKNGTLTGMNGASLLNMPVSDGNYYVVIYHRNHLAIMSAAALALSGSSSFYDFTTAQSQAYGSNPLTNLASGVFGMTSGDGDGDGGIDAADKNAYWRIHNGTVWQYGKYSDFNLNGGIDASDLNILWRNNNGASTQVPAPSAERLQSTVNMENIENNQ